MRAEFFREEKPEEVVGVAVWDGRRVGVRADEGAVREALSRVFRPSPVVVDDPSARALSASGPTFAEPGDLRWFRAAAQVRGREERLAVRFATDSPGGWDPAGAYRELPEWLALRESSGSGEPT